jgi:hypothetical protein
MTGNFMSTKWQRKIAAILPGTALFCAAVVALGQNSSDADCIVSQNGVCLDAVIQNTPPETAAPKATPVTFKKGRLTIAAEGTNLREILKAVSSQTGVDITFPQEGLDEKVFVHLGPGPMRDVLVDLLNGSSFNYVMLSSPADPTVLQHLVLTSRNSLPAPAVFAAAPPPAPAADPALYGQGFSADTNEAQNNDVDAARTTNAEWANKQGAIIDQMQKQRIKQREQEQQQQQQPAAPPPE